MAECGRQKMKPKTIEIPTLRSTGRPLRVLGRIGIGCFLTVTLAALVGCAAKRLDPPPENAPYRLPWGAVPVESWEPGLASSFHQDLVEGIRTRVAIARRDNPNTRVPYRVLALSGGGSRGAFGAGVLIGWTKSGSRPQFDVVTGISTGALMATFTFLGSDYDDELRLYTEVSNKDIYRKRSWLKGLFSDAFVDTAPLRQLIADHVTEETLAQVARAHAAGRRLFVGTVNLDASAFTVWDMGAIAASDRPDKLQRYRDVILASASLPGLFPPVYIPVDIGGERYWQMHVDGGVREPVFFYDFVDEVVQAFAKVGLDIEKEVHAEVFVLHNGTLYAEATYKPVKPRSLSIAGASVKNLMRKNTVSSLYRLWVQALVYGTDFHIAYSPPEFDVDWGPAEFDPEKMRRLFDFAYQRAAQGTAFVTRRAVSNYDELIRLVDPMQVLDPLEARPQFRLEEK